ncbi:hypothetical protein SeMB42_g02391 [Synchytrium endobioticum]|uniref:Uncharacterized protein n=1 Tax=Synchytrium endobioticum TaxID=286115 RepID=A0A507DEJ4_9FUNG|nr:hypothetical protein SeMB42_g02391 [Synchytrium endobioticum]
MYCYEDEGAGWPSSATSFCPDAQLVPSTVWRLKTDTSPALFVLLEMFKMYNRTRELLCTGIGIDYMLPPWVHAAWNAVPPDEW